MANKLDLARGNVGAQQSPTQRPSRPRPTTDLPPPKIFIAGPIRRRMVVTGLGEPLLEPRIYPSTHRQQGKGSPAALHRPEELPKAFLQPTYLNGENSKSTDDGSQAPQNLEEFVWIKDEIFTSNNGFPGQIKSCAACLEGKPSGIMLQAPCEDWYCHSCASKLFETAATDQAMFPAKFHSQEIPIASATSFLTQRIIKQYDLARQESTSFDRTYCAGASCGRFLPFSRLIECPDCGTTTCAGCKTRGHDGQCLAGDGTEEMGRLATQEGWRTCFNCNAVVEKTGGCNHMTCRCGSQFCYICGNIWKTCECRVSDRLAARGVAPPEPALGWDREQDPFLNMLNFENMHAANVQLFAINNEVIAVRGRVETLRRRFREQLASSENISATIRNQIAVRERMYTRHRREDEERRAREEEWRAREEEFQQRHIQHAAELEEEELKMKRREERLEQREIKLADRMENVRQREEEIRANDDQGPKTI